MLRVPDGATATGGSGTMLVRAKHAADVLEQEPATKMFDEDEWIRSLRSGGNHHRQFAAQGGRPQEGATHSGGRVCADICVKTTLGTQ